MRAVTSGVLLQCAQERYDGLPREQVEWARWLEVEAPHRSGFLASMAKVFTTAGRHPQRFCDRDSRSVFGGVEFAGMHELEVRGTYLRRCLGEEALHRRYWSRADEAAAEEVWAVSRFSPPSYYAPPPVDAGLVEVDLVAAYVQMFEHFSTRVEYRTASGIWAPVGEPFLDTGELRRHKTVYASIASHAWRSRHSPRWVRGEWVEQRGISATYNPQAARLLVDILHAVAQEMVGLLGAVAVKTDSYVLRADRASLAIDYLRGRWGLESRVKTAWEPGQPWPTSWAHNYQATRSNIREQADQVRQNLALGMTGEGTPLEACPMLTNSGLIVPPEQPYEPEPEPEPWQTELGLGAWEMVECPPLPEPVAYELVPQVHMSRRPCVLTQCDRGEVVLARGP